MLCSTIIPTIGRPSLLVAVESVLDQGLHRDDFEIIVVNDSGQALPLHSQSLDNVTVVETNRRNRSTARNVGAACARGRYLHFLDDDDRLLPGALEALLNLAETSEAAWNYGGFRMVDNAGSLVAEIRPVEAGNSSLQMLAWEWIPLQASLIKADAFLAVDGFASLTSLGGGFEDIHLSRQISLAYEMAGTDQIVSAIRIGDVGSTTNYVTMFEQNRRSREIVLGSSRAFRRLMDSARTSAHDADYWHGKVAYYYFASMRWQAAKGNAVTAAARGLKGLAGLSLAGSRLLTKSFWRGALRPHRPRMEKAIREAGADHLYSNTRRAMHATGAGR